MLLYSERKKYTLEDAEKDFETLCKLRINDMTRIKLRCWIAYCRFAKKEENAEQAMSFDSYCNVVCSDTYIGHINSGEIDCDDIGGKEKAVDVVKKWFGIEEEE